MTRSLAQLLGLLLLSACGGGAGDGDAAVDAAADTATADAGDAGPVSCTDDATCDDGLFCNGAERCAPSEIGAASDGCVAGEAPCLVGQVCDESAGRCLTQCDLSGDADGDGHDSIDCSGDDCDDSDPGRFPSNTEVCDAEDHDEDCDPTTFGALDLDGDSFFDARCCNVDASGTRSCGTDCDDGEPSVNPATAEDGCNGVDDNCDGMLAATEDVDGDGFASLDCMGTDCDDMDADIHPGATELCDGVDSDCSLVGAMTGGPELAEDADGDMHAPIGAACTGGPFPMDDCDDTVASVHPGASEVCNGADDDCDGTVDNEPASTDACASFPGTTIACVAGACSVSSCPSGVSDCNMDGADGCESDPTSDALNCGGCGGACMLACLASSCDEATAVAAGGDTSCALRASGRVACWGSNSRGQLGDGVTGASIATPTALPSLTGIQALAVGGEHTCALRTSGRVACWGNNDSGQLGDGTTVSRTTSADVVGATLTDRLGGVTGLSLGGGHSCAVTAGGIRCWGSGTSGQLGDGFGIDRLSPSGVMGLSAMVQVASGSRFSCGLHSSGLVSCWGRGVEGQLGDGALATRLTPVSVSGVGDAVEVVAGVDHACARRASGSVVCWGTNDAGQLGDGSTTPRTVPVPVVGLSDAAQLSLGDGFSCARRTTGSVVCWGDNGRGQLGDGDGAGARHSRPVTVVGLSDAVDLSSGRAHTCARRASGQLMCWGSNDLGSIGDATRALRRMPTDVVRFGS